MKNCRCGGPLVMRRKRTFNHETVVWACQDCHRGAGAVSRRDVAALSYEQLRDMPRAVVVHRRQPTKKTRDYKAALASAHTRKIKAERMEIAKGVCEIQGRDCRGKATDLYHVTYARLGEELIEDVRVSCSQCNQDERRERLMSGRRA